MNALEMGRSMYVVWLVCVTHDFYSSRCLLIIQLGLISILLAPIRMLCDSVIQKCSVLWDQIWVFFTVLWLSLLEKEGRLQAEGVKEHSVVFLFFIDNRSSFGNFLLVYSKICIIH